MFKKVAVPNTKPTNKQFSLNASYTDEVVEVLANQINYMIGNHDYLNACKAELNYNDNCYPKLLQYEFNISFKHPRYSLYNEIKDYLIDKHIQINEIIDNTKSNYKYIIRVVFIITTDPNILFDISLTQK